MKKPKKKTPLRISVPTEVLQSPAPWMRISDSALTASQWKKTGLIVNPFEQPLPLPPPRTLPPRTPKAAIMAYDEQVIEANAWAAQAVYNGAFFNGITFMGFIYLSELAQRPEYRRITEVLATAATKEWIEFGSTSTDDDTKVEKINQLTQRCKELGIQDVIRKKCEMDGFFGRAHIYLDTGQTDDLPELKRSIGNGRDKTTDAKLGTQRNFLKAVRCIEPVWCYPAKYEAADPLKGDWYNPQTWFVQGKEVHITRLLTSFSREVPDLLKPAYMFSGLSLSQMAKPYVDNWLRTRQAVADLIWSFSVRILKTNMAALMGSDGTELFRRVAFFANLQNNQSMMIVDKDREDVTNLQTSLASLDALQAQSQEHMCSVTGTPVVVLLGIQPAGLNASSQGELNTWDSWVESYQEKFITKDLDTIVAFVQRDLWGAVDDDIVWTYRPLRSLSAKELAEVQLIEMQRDIGYIEGQVLDPMDVRKRLAADPDSPFDGLGVDDGSSTIEELADGADPEQERDLSKLFNLGPRQERDGRAPRRNGDRTATRRSDTRGDVRPNPRLMPRVMPGVGEL